MKTIKLNTMRKLILFTALFAVSFASFAQVGIGTTTPNATLEIEGDAATAGTADGVIAPRLTGDQLRAKNAAYSAANHEGAIVYITTADTAPATKTVNVTSAGYYYYDGNDVWQTFGSSSSSSFVTLGGVTDVDCSSDVTIPSDGGAVYNLTNGGVFGGPTITLPATNAGETGKLLTIINLNSTTTINLANIVGNNTSMGGGKSGLFISNGVSWILIVED